MNVNALNNKIIVQVSEPVEQVTSGGIIVPEKDKRLPVQATVVSVGAKVEADITKGNVILCHLGALNTLDQDSDLQYIDEEDLLASVV